ncbi:probable sugar phosphate/phosphate translocator At3g11320 [Cucumis sativus]|uniref:Sugar phosphate transporter domain-containing protein n=1 Tax=Cucumis sativus TaxID=3659 RepID=A0A0A0K8G8_CUCSA|nr:probable sugar phosphate/phosphate translocator At3g11320 [Cucumis sativus]KGN45768.1 hypothetical protein Csa_005751 [Cucumis sativus]
MVQLFSSFNSKNLSSFQQMTQILIFSPSPILSPFNGREQRWRKKIICCSRQHVWDKSLLQSNSGFRKIRASNSTAGSYGGSAEISKGQPLAWISTWPNKQTQPCHQYPPPKMKGTSRFFTIGLVAAWYSSNIGVLLLNKYLLSNYGFKYPIFLTMCHMTACSLLSYIAIAWLKLVPLQTIRSRVQFFKISALSFIFCISVVFGNISLRYLPVSFNQAIGATTPFFTAVFAYLMTLKREAWLTYVTLIPVVTGVIIASGGEPSFHLFGFLICVAATAARALKSVLQGILLSADGEKLNSMNLLLYMAPMAVVFLLPATLIMEHNVVGITLALARDDIKIIWYLLFNSSLAYFVNLTNFLVTKHTSALTLQVLGNAKGAVAVVVSILIFRNPVSVTGMFGYTLTVMGVILYSEAKKRANKS